MPIFKQNTKIGSIKKGTQNIKQVYRGVTPVWSSFIPPNFIELNNVYQNVNVSSNETYIQFSGTDGTTQNQFGYLPDPNISFDKFVYEYGDVGGFSSFIGYKSNFNSNVKLPDVFVFGNATNFGYSFVVNTNNITGDLQVATKNGNSFTTSLPSGVSVGDYYICSIVLENDYSFNNDVFVTGQTNVLYYDNGFFQNSSFGSSLSAVSTTMLIKGIVTENNLTLFDDSSKNGMNAQFVFFANDFEFKNNEVYYFVLDKRDSITPLNSLEFYMDAAFYRNGNTIENPIATDSIGNINGGVTYSNNFGGTFIFDGSTGHMIWQNTPLMQRQDYTIIVWTRPNSGELSLSDREGFWFEKGFVNTQYSFFIEDGVWKSRNAGLGSGGSSSTDVTNSISRLTSSNYQMVTVTKEGSTIRLYYNGTLVETQTRSGTFSFNNDLISIGSWVNSSFDTGYHFDGEIASVLGYVDALSITEINDYYNYMRSRFNV